MANLMKCSAFEDLADELSIFKERAEDASETSGVESVSRALKMDSDGYSDCSSTSSIPPSSPSDAGLDSDFLSQVSPDSNVTEFAGREKKFKFETAIAHWGRKSSRP